MIPRLPEQIVTDAAGLRECLEHLSTQAHIGLDTEFVGEDTYRPDLCLIQISTNEKLFLVDPLTCGDLESFWGVLADPARQVIVHAGREELRACQFALGRPPAHVFDVQVAAGLVGHTYPIGYGAIVSDLLGIRMSKGETLTDWRKRPLTAAQQSYAFDDVRYLLPLWKKLHDRLRRLNREDWAAEEFGAFVRKCVSEEPTVEKWRKIKGLGGASRRDLAVARELHLWRDSVAARQNRPPRSVLRDEVLVDIARRAPIREEDVAAFRGLARSLVPGLLEAVRKARTLVPAEYPEPAERDNDLPHVQLLAGMLNLVLSEWCMRNHLASNQVATMAELKAVVRARQPGGPLPGPSPLFTGWRSRVILPELEAFLDGRRTLVVTDPASSHPLAVTPRNPDAG
jgi:ribonuclease D